jgi:hypothetical protein
MLSSDSFTEQDLTGLASCLGKYGLGVPYNLMLRGEKWISDQIGASLGESGCTDVFIGAEALDNNVLRLINKGITVESIINAVKCLSSSVKVTIGLLLFIPRVTERQLQSQIKNLERVIPYIHAVEPEILSVVQATEFARRHSEYGMRLWATEKTINDSWCYGLSPDIPWTFEDGNEAEMWFRFCEQLREMLGDYVEPHYWDSIDAVRLRF